MELRLSRISSTEEREEWMQEEAEADSKFTTLRKKKLPKVAKGSLGQDLYTQKTNFT